MSDPVYVRVTANGKDIKRELIVDGVKVRDMSFVDVVQLIMQATSSLRHGREKLWD